MRPRVSLYAKILLWFFVNLGLLVAVFAAVFYFQFRVNLDWVFATGARDRIEAVRDLIVGELETAWPDEWPHIIERFSSAYRVRFALFDDQAERLVGNVAKLPEPVRERILARSRPPTATVPSSDSAQAPRRWRGPPLRAFLRTTDPARYWLLLSARLDNPLAGDPMRVVLVAESHTLSSGGLVFDVRPWVEVAIGAVAFSVLFWLLLVRGITRFIGRVNEATQRIAEGRFDVRVKTRRHDELGVLAESINQMAERLDGFAKGQKRFLSDIAHELCSPLARLQMALGILEQRADDAQKNYVRSASEKAAQIAALVGELLSFSKASYGAAAVRLQPVRVCEAAEQAVKQESVESAEIQLNIPTDLAVAADAELLTRALANLLRNAIRHGATAGPIVVGAQRTDGEVAISVADAGPGVPEEELPLIFDAFHRVDTARSRESGGTGLGLTIVKACVESCCGTVVARNREPHGLEVVVHLPAAELPAGG